MTNPRRTALITIFAIAGIVGGTVFRSGATVNAADGTQYTSDGKLILPTGYRKWTFIGAPLTPHGLNSGKAGFPEYHNVYVQDQNLTIYQKIGAFPEGTVIVKELLLVRPGKYPDGSGDTPAGRGFSEGAFNGMDVSVKDSKRYAATNGWGFFNFGHHALPYAVNSKESSKEDCAGCHIAGAAKTDMTWVDFYPVLQGKN